MRRDPRTRTSLTRGRSVGRLVLFLTLGSALAVACGPAAQSGSSAPGSPTGTATESSAPSAATEPVTIQLWGNNFNMDHAEVLTSAYTASHPEVKFEITRQDDINTAARVGLQSGSLDVLVHDPGLSTTNQWAAAGLLRPIDDYWDQYQWDDRISDYGKAGATYKGQVYGVTNEVSFIAQLYQTSVFEKYSLSEPTTYDAWVSVLKTLKEGGETPLVAGLRGGSQADHVFTPFLQASVGRDGMEKLLFGDGKWTDPGVVEAANRMVEVARSGYLDKDTLALDYNEAQARFLAGSAAINMNGVWSLSQTEEVFGEDGYDFMTIPPWDDSVTANYGGGLGSQWSIAASSEHADAIAAYLDWMYSEEGLKIWVEDRQTFPPVKADFTAFDLSRQQLKMADIIAKSDTGTISHWLIVYLPPNVVEIFNQGVSGVVSEQVTPEAWLADMQEGWEAAIADGSLER